MAKEKNSHLTTFEKEKRDIRKTYRRFLNKQTSRHQTQRSDLLNTICQLECELDVREAQLAALKRGRANMLRWAKRYRKLVRKHMEDKYAESSQD